MPKALGSFIIAVLVALAFMQPAHSAQRASGPTEEVCSIARDMCMKACEINNPGDDFNSGLLRDLCERDCDEQRKACENPGGGISLAHKMSKGLIAPIFGMDGTPSDRDDKPANDTKPPADPTDGKGDDGGFDPNTTFGDGTPLFSPN
jgi:hypothetical protein